MAKFHSHVCEFFEHIPVAIQYMTYNHPTSELAIAREDNSIEIWKVTENVCWLVKKISSSEDHSIEALCWCQGELITAGLTGEISVYNLNRQEIKKTITASSSAIWCMKPNYDSSAIALGTEDGSIIIYAVTKEEKEVNFIFYKIISHESKRIICLAWAKNDKYLVTGSLGVAKVWDYKSGSVINRLPFPSTKKGDTVIWCIDMFGGKTVVCGDSTGTVSFWNAQHGTLLQEHKRHRADVLCMWAHEGTRKIYCAGVDPFIIIYERVQTGHNKKSWVYSNHRNLHTHDVRAMCSTPHYLLTGGVDCNLVLSKYPPKTRIAIPNLPQCSVQVPLKSSKVLLKYVSHLELWALGSVVGKDTGSATSQLDVGHQLAVDQAPQKVFEIHSKHDEAIISACISPKCDWLVYAMPTLLRLFHLSQDSETGGQMVVQKIGCDFRPSRFVARCVTWLGETDQFMVATANQSLLLMKVDPVHADLLHTFSPSENPSAVIHLLVSSDSGEFVAAADEAGNVSVYNTIKKNLHCRLPQYQYPAAAMCFHTDSGGLDNLLVAYADNKLLEFSVRKRVPTEFSHELSSFLAAASTKEKWFAAFDTICTITCDKDCVMLQSAELLVTISKAKEKKQELLRQVKTCTNFKYLIHGGLLHDGYILIVQKTPQDLLEVLPPALKVKTFGN